VGLGSVVDPEWIVSVPDPPLKTRKQVKKANDTGRGFACLSERTKGLLQIKNKQEKMIETKLHS
jgi:hypothetical protein